MTTDSNSSSHAPAGITADLCVVGAGIAGLNALAVASTYLEPGQRIVLIERRPRGGGMWNDAYGFVRLHQPHPFFTAGSVAWEIDQPRSYLATRDEVLDHFERVLDFVRARVELDERYGWEFIDREERDGRVRVRVRDADGEQVEIDAARLIEAYGLDIETDIPLELTSDRVRSISPSTLVERRDEVLGGDDPVWIVGGGKTAMDTAHLLIKETPGRDVNMIIGAGTLFGNRDRLFPEKTVDRWRVRRTPNMINAEVARRFNGTNEADVRRWMRDGAFISLVPDAENFFFGLLSEAENETISRGLASIVSDHFVDARDQNGGAELVFRSGDTKDVPTGSWIVNCTGLIGPVERPYEPYASPSGNVLTLSMRSATLLLPGFVGYFMTHLMYNDKLATTPLYAIDVSELMRSAKHASPYVMAAATQYNLHLLSDALPLKAILGCGLDFDRWMPMPHRLVSNVSFVARRKRDVLHHRATLETSRERFGIRCGPLEFMEDSVA